MPQGRTGARQGALEPGDACPFASGKSSNGEVESGVRLATSDFISVDGIFLPHKDTHMTIPCKSLCQTVSHFLDSRTNLVFLEPIIPTTGESCDGLNSRVLRIHSRL